MYGFTDTYFYPFKQCRIKQRFCSILRSHNISRFPDLPPLVILLLWDNNYWFGWLRLQTKTFAPLRVDAFYCTAINMEVKTACMRWSLLRVYVYCHTYVAAPIACISCYMKSQRFILTPFYWLGLCELRLVRRYYEIRNNMQQSNVK